MIYISPFNHQYQAQIYKKLRIGSEEYTRKKITFQWIEQFALEGATKCQKLAEVSNGRAGVLRSHLASAIS